MNHVPNILELVHTVSDLPIRYVLNTRHHGDHASGNAPLRAMGIDVVGHENIRSNFLRIKQPGEPNIAFADKASVFSGGVEVQLLHLGRGHTSGDTVIYFPDLKTVHAGDLIVDGMPVIDYAGGGSAVEFVKTIGALLEVDFDTLIPGHGRLMTKREVATTSAFRGDEPPHAQSRAERRTEERSAREALSRGSRLEPHRQHDDVGDEPRAALRRDGGAIAAHCSNWSYCGSCLQRRADGRALTVWVRPETAAGTMRNDCERSATHRR